MVRVKQLWDVAPIPAKTKLVWSRLTCNRLVASYFAFTVVHCFLQVLFQFSAHTVNLRASNLLDTLVSSAGLQMANFTLYNAEEKSLLSCWGVPNSGSGNGPCRVVWQARGLTVENSSYAINPVSVGSSFRTSLPSSSSSSSPLPTPTPTITTTTTSSNLDAKLSSSALSSTLAASVTSISLTSTTARATPSPIPREDDDEGSDSDDDEDEDDRPGSLTRTSTTTIRVTATRSTSSSPTSTSVSSVTRRRTRAPSMRKRHAVITPITGRSDADPLNTTVTGLQITGLASGDADPVEVTLQCAQVVRWPLQTLLNTEREDLVFVGFQIWMFSICIVALLNESIPHIIAALLAHVMAMTWSSFQLAHTAAFRMNFLALTVNGACKGVNLLPDYWKARAAAEIPVLVLNCVALVVSALLSWKLAKVFGWATFRRVGAELRINWIYKLVLCLTILLQLSLFFIITSLALWIDQLYNGSIGRFEKHGDLHRVIDIILLLLLVPWLTLGWFGVRKENKKMMYGFLVLSVVYIGEWALMFASGAWRLTFLNWAFFATMSTLAVVFTIAVLILGVVCQRNFGMGLSNYLKPLDNLEGEDFQKINNPGDLEDSGFSADEKIPFPSNNLPGYTEMFGPSPPAQVHPRDVFGPGNHHTDDRSITTRSADHRVSISNTQDAAQDFVTVPLSRTDSRGSNKTVSSLGSHETHVSAGTQISAGRSLRKKWSIE